MEIALTLNNKLIFNCYFDKDEAEKVINESFPDCDQSFLQKQKDNIKSLIKNSQIDEYGSYTKITYERGDTGRYYIKK